MGQIEKLILGGVVDGETTSASAQQASLARVLARALGGIIISITQRRGL